MVVAVVPATSVYPSGADLATASLPSAPPAPARFSTTKGWPICLAIDSPSKRAVTSRLPPGANGTTIFTGFEGKACASAASAARQTASTPSDFTNVLIADSPRCSSRATTSS